ncbi:MAG: nucleoside hydrolase [Acidimicrobiales bacterium]
MNRAGRGRPVLLDCDPGYDDALALLFALGSPSIDLLAVTTVFGNGPLEQTSRTAGRVLALAGRTDVPLAAGAAGPLIGGTRRFGGRRGGAEPAGLPPAHLAVEPVDTPAVDLMASLIRTAREPVTLVATGPATNTARLVRDHPDLHHRIADLVVMAGSARGGNCTPTAEFNAASDPEALDILLDVPGGAGPGRRPRLVGLDLTRQAVAPADVIHRLTRFGHEPATVAAAWLTELTGACAGAGGGADRPVHDLCAAAAVVDPTVMGWTPAVVTVDLDGHDTRGTTVVDDPAIRGRAANAQVATALDLDRFWAMVIDALDRLGSGRGNDG